MQPILELNNISKSFFGKAIYQSLSLNLEKGCHALVGKNGSGKSVLIEMLAGVSIPDNGNIQLSGVGYANSFSYKEKLTYIPSSPIFFPTATGYDFLNFMMAVKKSHNDHENIANLINCFKLSDHLETEFTNMSLGTQKKLFLATLAFDKSKLIILDEPTNSLDAESSNILYEIIRKLSQDKIVIIATHDDHLLNEITPTVMTLNKHPITHLIKSNR